MDPGQIFFKQLLIGFVSILDVGASPDRWLDTPASENFYSLRYNQISRITDGKGAARPDFLL